MEGDVLLLQPARMQVIELGEPDPEKGYDVLACTNGGYRILTWVVRNSRWEVRNNDGTTQECRLAIHYWCYLA